MKNQPKLDKITDVSRPQSQPGRQFLANTSRSRTVIRVSFPSSYNILPRNRLSFTTRTEPTVSATKSNVSNFSATHYSVRKPRISTNLSTRHSVRPLDKTTLMITDHASTNKKKFLIEPIETNPIEDHHREKSENQKDGRVLPCVLFFVVILIAAIIATATTLGIKLSNKPPRKITSSKNATLRWNPVGTTVAGIAGVTGVNASVLRLPYGLAFDSSNTLHIVDYQNNRIQKLISGTSMTETVAGDTNGAPGNAANRFNWPVDILFDSNDNLYVADRTNNRIQLWAKGATSGITVAGVTGNNSISLNFPTAIIFGSDASTIFIADTFNQQIISYPSGVIVAGGNGAGNANTQLFNPFGLIYDSLSRSFIIPNYDTHNIVRWVLGENNRTVIAGDMQGNFGSNSTLLRSPVGIKMDPMGNIYVADSDNHRIQLFMAGQSTGITIAGDGTAGTNAHQLNTPYWVLLDNQLNLYVSDTSNHRVQKFSRY